jgi:ribose transport system substrate-binding protein
MGNSKIGIKVVMSALLMASMLFVSCGQVKTDGELVSSNSGNLQQSSKLSPKKDAYSDPIKIAFLPNVIGDTVANAWGDGAEQELSTFPNITFQRFDGKASSETQGRIMQDLINQQYDAIILQCSDSAAAATFVQQAESANIPVITLNLDADTTHTGLITMVDYEAGALVANNMANGMGEQGNVVIIQASPGATRGERLEAGFRDEMEKHENITILDSQSGEWLTEKANVVMNDFLTKYPEIGGVFAHNDAMAEGASQAASSAGRLEGMQIWGADGEKKALEYIEKGMLTGTIYTNCYDQGATAARLAIYAIGAGLNGTKLEVTPVVKMAPIVVTQDNVGSISENIRW